MDAPKPIKEIRFQHWRLVGWTLLRRHEWKERGIQPCPRGGWTKAVVKFEDGTTAIGTAECSQKDNYCRKIGRDIALGRALARAKEAA